VLPRGRERLRDQSFAARKGLGPVQTGSASHSAHRMRRSAKILSEAVYSVINVIRMTRGGYRRRSEAPQSPLIISRAFPKWSS
jgi:hypothetical protein